MTKRMQLNNHYRVAELPVTVIFTEGQPNGPHLIRSFEPFRTTEGEDKPFLHLTVDDTIRPFPKAERERIREVDTGNGVTIVDAHKDGGYQFIIKDIFGNSCCLLKTNKEFNRCECALNGTEAMRTFGINNAAMLIFAFAGSLINTVLIHASLVRNDGWGYAFVAKSGTGKSTQVSMWLKHIPGCDLMNDDNPIIRIIDGTPYIYGSPWSGKTPCYRNVKAPLGAITRIVRDNDNFVQKLRPIDAFTSLLPSVSTMKWDNAIFDNICNIITKLIETTPNYDLHCRPDKEAALVCHKSIARSTR